MDLSAACPDQIPNTPGSSRFVPLGAGACGRLALAPLQPAASGCHLGLTLLAPTLTRAGDEVGDRARKQTGELFRPETN